MAKSVRAGRFDDRVVLIIGVNSGLDWPPRLHLRKKVRALSLMISGGADRADLRFGTSEECATAVLFLVSNDASFIAGIDLLVDSGAVSFRRLREKATEAGSRDDDGSGSVLGRTGAALAANDCYRKYPKTR